MSSTEPEASPSVALMIRRDRLENASGSVIDIQSEVLRELGVWTKRSAILHQRVRQLTSPSTLPPADLTTAVLLTTEITESLRVLEAKLAGAYDEMVRELDSIES